MISSTTLAVHSPEPASEVLRALQALPKFASALSPTNEDRLLELFNTLLNSGKSYDSIRVQILQLSFLLNFRRKVAPRFRALPSPPFRGLTDSEILLSQDRQFVDLHWLLCRGHRRIVSSDTFADLFQNESKFCELAGLFTCENWTTETKIKALQISSNTQWQLASLQSAGIRDRWRIIEYGDVRGGTVRVMGAAQARLNIEDSVAGQPRFAKYVDDWVTVWKAGKISEETGIPLTAVYELMTGVLRDRKGLGRKLETVIERLRG
ncbi:hypothetical protein [Pseudomonas sp. PDM27]|uniref:hypothetical protein n=1 Tax=Pseudomonas sp. PDM27 TaxID=2854769 RepID=UPI001C45D729|nr:hypothetical protein [Pseudomonas sp. PDM27]MBV7568473.1 hypothetical protein [Pseudomonas sp. PDM27]